MYKVGQAVLVVELVVWVSVQSCHDDHGRRELVLVLVLVVVVVAVAVVVQSFQLEGSVLIVTVAVVVLTAVTVA